MRCKMYERDVTFNHSEINGVANFLTSKHVLRALASHVLEIEIPFSSIIFLKNDGTEIPFSSIILKNMNVVMAF